MPGPKRKKSSAETQTTVTKKNKKNIPPMAESSSTKKNEPINSSQLSMPIFRLPSTVYKSDQGLGALPNPVLAKIFSFLSPRLIGRMSGLSRYLNVFTKTTDGDGNTVNSNQSIYGLTKFIFIIEQKLEALGFEKELMPLWFKGFDDSYEKLRELNTLVDIATDVLNDDDNEEVKSKGKTSDKILQVREQFANYLEVKFERDSDMLDPQTRKTNGSLQDNENFNKNLDAIVNTNPFVLYMMIYLYFPSTTACEGLKQICGNQSLQALRLIAKKMHGNSKLNYLKEIQPLIEAILRNKTGKENVLAAIIAYSNIHIPTSTIVNDIINTREERLGDLNKITQLFSKNGKYKIRSLLLKNNIDTPQLLKFMKIEIPLSVKPGQKGIPATSNFFIAMTKTQELTQFLLIQAERLGLDWEKFAERHAKAIGFLSQKTKADLESMSEEETIGLFKNPGVIISEDFRRTSSLKEYAVLVRQAGIKDAKEIEATAEFLCLLNEKYPEAFKLLDDTRERAHPYQKAYIRKFNESLKTITLDEASAMIMQSSMPRLAELKILPHLFMGIITAKKYAELLDKFFNVLEEMKNEQSEGLYKLLQKSYQEPEIWVFRWIVPLIFEKIKSKEIDDFVQWFKETNMLQLLYQSPMDVPQINRLLGRFDVPPMTQAPLTQMPAFTPVIPIPRSLQQQMFAQLKLLARQQVVVVLPPAVAQQPQNNNNNQQSGSYSNILDAVTSEYDQVSAMEEQKPEPQKEQFMDVMSSPSRSDSDDEELIAQLLIEDMRNQNVPQAKK